MKKIIVLMLVLCVLAVSVGCTKPDVSDYDTEKLFSIAVGDTDGCVRFDTERSDDTFLSIEGGDKSEVNGKTSMSLVTDRKANGKLAYAAETSMNNYRLLISYADGKIYHTGDLGYYYSDATTGQAEALLKNIKNDTVSELGMSAFESVEKATDGDCTKLICQGLKAECFENFAKELSGILEGGEDVKFDMQSFTLTYWIDADAKPVERSTEFVMLIDMKYDGKNVSIKRATSENTVYSYYEDGKYEITAPKDLSYYTKINIDEMYPELAD